MMNADEHKKLLEQITELERGSINYFDVEKEFFLIDSDNLSQVRPKFYGYSIQRTGIYEQDNLTAEAIAGLDGRGCYVYVEVKDGKITIKQDLNGSWGIYLFRHGDYFALSNSFFRLLDHIKFKYPLTVNRDYCNYFLVNSLCSHAYSETAVNEISLIDRSAILHIDIARKNFDIEMIDYKEDSVSLNSKEGMAVLDNWVEFWGDVFRGLTQHTKFISADLSGGFDSRIVFVPLLNSGLDLTKIKINSRKTNIHTYTEDYAIASKIAEHYGFKLNQPFPVQQQFLNLSLADTYNIDLYALQSFHKHPSMPSTIKRINKIYLLNGYGGETIRKYWHSSPRIFIENQTHNTKSYPLSLSLELSRSIKAIIESAFCSIRDKYKLKDENAIILPQYLYNETRCRNHFGKSGLLSEYLKNNVLISPVLDPDLRTLQINTLECPDTQLLIALIFTRYEPDLLKFPFEGKRFISPETIAYAQKLNKQFPRRQKDIASVTEGGYFNLQPRDTQTEKILSSGRNNPNIPAGLPETYLKASFESSRTYGLFTAYFDAELYHYAASYYEKNYYPLRYMNGVVGITKVLEAVEISRREQWTYHDMKYFLEQDFCQIHDSESQIINRFRRFFTARIDTRLKSTEGDFQILSVSDRVNVVKPTWLNREGVGYMITSYVGKLEFIAQITVDGQIQLRLMGVYVPDPKDKTKRIPYWIDYTKLTVNGKIIFDTLTPAWHDKPYFHKIDAKAGEEIKIQVEWQPHRSDT